MNAPGVQDMTDDQLRAGLLGAMEWQRIVQRRKCGPKDAREALRAVGPYARETAWRLNEPSVWTAIVWS